MLLQDAVVVLHVAMLSAGIPKTANFPRCRVAQVETLTAIWKLQEKLQDAVVVLHVAMLIAWASPKRGNFPN